MAVSNNITSVLNFIAFLCSVPIIASGIWLASKPDNECIRWLRWPVVFIGILILLVSLLGFVGAYWNKQILLSLYLCFMAILIVLLLSLLILAFVVTRPGGAYHVPGRAFEEYRLAGFSSWLRDHITNSDNWGKIRACLAESDACSKLSQEFLSADQFFAAHISPLQTVKNCNRQPLDHVGPTIRAITSNGFNSSSISLWQVHYGGYTTFLMSGCCKPPSVCGYQYVNPTMWINPVNQMGDVDCSLWNNDPSQLCYGCDSCKAGLLGNLRKEWRRANVILIVALVVLIWVYVIACSALKNAQTEELFSQHKQGWV